MMSEVDDSLFTLSNGRTIVDPAVSDKMRMIVGKNPSQNYQSNAIGYSWNESGMAQLFAECYDADTRYCPEVKSWFTYSDGAWRKDVGAHLVSSKIVEFYQLMVLYGYEIANDDLRSNYLKFVSRLGTRRFRENMLKDAADNELLTVYASQFDAHPYLINCRNGTFDLNKRIFREHNRQDLLTMQTNFDYTLQEKSYERWKSFIEEVTQGDRDKARYLQKAVGYSMLGSANEECMFILHGKTTRNGKSTLLSAIHHLLGDYASVAPVAIICKSDRNRDGEAPSPVLASLKGRRFVTMSESNQYGKLDEETIKQLTGGEEITARNLHEKPITFLPQFTLWLSCNDLPSVSDKSLFASERLRVIEFNRHFSPEEQDKNLKNEFQTTEAMQGIFSWMVAGYYDYLAHGLTMSRKMQAVVEKYRKDNDLVLQFLEEKCEKVQAARGLYTRAKNLYDSYKIWCKSNGYFCCSSKKFIAEMDVHPEWYRKKDLWNDYITYFDIILKGSDQTAASKTQDATEELPM